MSSATLTTAGILLVTVVAVAYGGLTLLTHLARSRAGYLDNPVRRGLWTAGHAHAGVLVLFALVVLPYIDQADVSAGTATLIRSLFVAAPILMPLGFFLSVVRPRDTRPNKLIWLTVAGGGCLMAGALLLGVNLL
ncbi:hypothetical protein ACFOOK_21205 [Micromonospora krabiensis]|uniref:Uncharacterized protein n=1 Tax=Micromonospora krabiensis TaxID=307121 RepID=A0A1C3N8K1_9ACTN|nr:hypothetical protein [Micromonospora krabiensis]SBV28912.1 hypothetical protein GA0070620_4471 [Micromonospora krabiensis]